jgi:hypothetical protein
MYGTTFFPYVPAALAEAMKSAEKGRRESARIALPGRDWGGEEKEEDKGRTRERAGCKTFL